MKKNNNFLGWFTLVVLGLLSACARDVETPDRDTDQFPIQIGSAIYQTRATGSSFCDGDQLGIFVVDYNGETPGELIPEGNRGDNVRFTYDENTGHWTPSQTLYYKDDKTKVDVYGYYPYASALSSITNYAFSVQKDQNRVLDNKMTGYEASDFLWGKTEGVAPTKERIDVIVRHRLSCVSVRLAEGKGFEPSEWAGLEKQMLIVNTKQNASLNLATGEVQAVGDVSTVGIVPLSEGDGFRAIVVPQEVAASTPLFSITVDGTPYTFRKSEAFAYISTRMHEFTVTVDKKAGGGLEFVVEFNGITAWDNDNLLHGGDGKEYVIIDVTTPGTLGATITASGKDVTKLQNLKLTGTIDRRDFIFMRDQMTSLQCLNLKEVSIAKYDTYPANEISENAMENKVTLTRLTLPDNIIKIGSYAFKGTNITGSVIIPEGVIEIGGFAFQGCGNLSGTLTLPSTLQIIGESAFYDCSGLIGNLNIPQSVTKIGDSAFYQCSGFTGELVLPVDLEELRSSAFFGCENLIGSLTIPDKIKKIERSTFNSCIGMKGQLKMAADVTYIGPHAFSNCGFRGELHLPETLTFLGEGAFYNAFFSGTLILPKSLTIIEGDAWGVFNGCKRLSGTVTIPEGFTSVPENIFNQCTQLEGIVLPSTMEQIKEKAFYYCSQINSIKCLAKDPPYIRAGAFDGVAKDNFTVEVPEQSLASYQTAPGWKDFKRISAYRDFSINRRLIRALNASFSQDLILRTLSDYQWEVASKPDWVEVSPSSGTGRAELKVTINALAKGGSSRNGEVKFLLKGKNYYQTLTVEQYNYTYEDKGVQTLQQATEGAGVNIVFVGDGFDAKDISNGNYKRAMETAFNHFIGVEPVKNYKNCFNAYTVYALSPESGMETINTITQNKFGTTYVNGLTTDKEQVFSYACCAPINNRVDNALVVLVPNSTEYAGITYMWGDGSSIAICPMSNDYYPYDFRGIVQHEVAGHALGKLGDEYIYVNGFVDKCSCENQHIEELLNGQARGWYQNLSASNNYLKVPWSEFIYHPKYANLVDVFEGGWFHTRKVWRSEPNSCMNNNIPYFNAVSRREIVKRIKSYAGEVFNFDDFLTRDVLDASSVTKSATPFSLPTYTTSPWSQQPPKYMGDKPNFKKRN